MSEPFAEEYLIGTNPKPVKGGFNFAGANSNCTEDNTQFNHSGSSIQVATALSGGGIQGSSYDLLLGLAPGVYTLQATFDIRTGPGLIQLVAGGNSIFRVVPTGRYNLCLPVRRGTNANLNTCTAAVFNIPLNGVVACECIRLFKGLFESINDRLTLPTINTPVTGFWQKGDAYVLAQPTSGSARTFVCTVAGALTSGAWAPTTNYAVGVHVSNPTLANVYVCTQAGTSAGSGGPNSNSSNIVDGTCIWQPLLCGTATFKAEAALS